MRSKSNQKSNNHDKIAKENVTPKTEGEISGINCLNFQLSIRKITIWLTIITLALNFLGLIGRGIEFILGIEETTEIVRLVHVAEEGNLTTWFSAMLLLISSIVLGFIARANYRHGKPYGKHWAFLSMIFFLMCLDESARIHELTIEPIRSLFNVSGVFHYAWVLLAIPFLIILAIAYWKFIRDLPSRSRLLIIIAGIFYVFSAMGMDMVVGYFISHGIAPRLLEPILITVEELGENLAIVLFIYALLSHLKTHETISEISLKMT